MAVVAVDALGLHLLAVDKDALVNDFNASCADEKGNGFRAAGQREHIEIRDFVRPELDVFHGRNGDHALAVDGSGLISGSHLSLNRDDCAVGICNCLSFCNLTY